MDFEETLEQLRAAGEATRLRTLALLSAGDLTVSELTKCLRQSQPRVSRHLRILSDAGLIVPYQEGSWRFYRLGDEPRWLDELIGGIDGDLLTADREQLGLVRAARQSKADAYFARHAEDWDALRQLHIDDREIEEALLELAPSGVRRFYDFGTGTGRMLILFRDRYQEGRGFDASPEMLEIARARLSEEHVVHARVRRRDITRTDDDLPPPADLVCLHHVLHFLGEPERAIGAAADLLTEGGVLLIADFAPHDLELLRERFAHRRLGFSSEEIAAYAAKCGLAMDAEKVLDPGPEGNLVSTIWRLVKTPAATGGRTVVEALCA